MQGTNGRGRRGLAAIAALAGAWVSAVVLNRAARDVEGTSMAPALWPGDRLLVVPWPSRALRRGDVVVVRDPRQPSRETVKRVVAGPGQVVDLGPGGLTLDGVAYREPYAAVSGDPAPLGVRTGEDLLASVRPDAGPWRVPDGHRFVAGDHRDRSTDSRAFGPVPDELVVGRVVWSVRPWGPVRRRPPVPRHADQVPSRASS